VGKALTQKTATRLEVRLVGQTFEKQVEVVWHEAVRKNLEAFLVTSTQNLRGQGVDEGGAREGQMLVGGAERQGIAPPPAVGELLESSWSAWKHAAVKAGTMPGGRCRSGPS
jgi:hypothetical protein